MIEIKYSVSFVIPCLNEQTTLPIVLDKISKVCQNEFHDRNSEIVVSDNGSTDDSIKIALEYGARVVNCKERGYGAALMFGFENAKHDAIVFADADDTYNFFESPKLLSELEKGFDLVLTSRIKGKIEKGAMPFLHRYLGTPVLSFIINMLFAKNGMKVSDCNSGFRCFKRDQFPLWGIQGSGMEFITEMAVKAMKYGAKISEVPITLYRDHPNRMPHLRTWRDGMRNVLQIFVDSPEFFNKLGFSIILLSWLIIASGTLFGPIEFTFASILGIHSIMFAVLGSIFGITIWGIGLIIATKQNASVKIYKFLNELSEDGLFWYSVLLFMICFALFSWIFATWAMQGFRGIELESETLALITIGSNGLLFITNVITAHMIKRI